MKLLGMVPVILLGLLLIGAIWDKVAPRYDCAGKQPKVSIRVFDGRRADKLYVLVHGLNAQAATQQRRWESMKNMLTEDGDVAMLAYPASAFSNADPSAVAARISDNVQRQWERKEYAEVVVIGNSIGALIARKALLYSAAATTGQVNHPAQALPKRWSDKVNRMILLAGMNRGWDLSGQKPADMRWYVYAAYAIGNWFGNLTYNGQLIANMHAGTPFVADLRLEWMRWIKQRNAAPDERTPLGMVQLLGDIDDLVSSEDTKDLQVAGHEHFAWIKVRGTDHDDILDMKAPSGERDDSMPAYRYKKFHAALSLSFADLLKQSEELPPATDPTVRRVVFIMHGIRDLGEWSSTFETALQRQMTQVDPEHKLAIASIRYGYFGMGQFLLRRDRQKYVQWFMDQYTETLARYPQAEEIHFIGHSNGTYLLASALEKYQSLRIDRLVLAGSVVPKAYPWKEIFDRKQVKLVRNYVAEDDMVVALFPRFFEMRPMLWLGNDIGSAGFNGFDAGDPGPNQQPVENIKYITGHHAAFMGHVDSIVRFLIPTDAEARAETPVAKDSKRTWVALKIYSDYFTWTLWAVLIFTVAWLGARMSWAAGHFSATALVIYAVIVLEVLRWV